jgi:hypothetical protein
MHHELCEEEDMYIIGENIHIISGKVKAAVQKRDARYLQKLAKPRWITAPAC